MGGDVPERDLISRQLVEMTTQHMRLREKMLLLAQNDYGLVADVTRVRQGEEVGTFLQVLNYFEPGPPYIRVRLLTGDSAGKTCNFYEDWEKIF